MSGEISAEGDHVGDPGLQNERTDLAWQRTALSLVVASATFFRGSFSALGMYVAVCLAVAVPVSGWMWIRSRALYLRASSSRAALAARDGRAGLTVSCIVTTLGIGALLIILST